jgi:hypothetical protein
MRPGIGGFEPAKDVQGSFGLIGKALARHSLPIEPPRRRDVQRNLPVNCGLRIADCLGME